MFNNIIYLIVVLLLFNVSFPGADVEESAVQALLMHLSAWLAFALYCKKVFSDFSRRPAPGGRESESAARYQGALTRLSILSVFLFAVNVYIFHLRYWLELVPGGKDLTVLPGALAIGVFFVYLATIWHHAYPAYDSVYGTVKTRRSFVIGNLRLNVPIVFPWLSLTFLYDLAHMSAWGRAGGFLESASGNMIFFAVFLFVLMIFMPGMIQYWWGCEPLPRTGRVKELENFLTDKNFKYRGLLDWPLFGGRMVTAGIMGIVPRFRYILMTKGLMDLLTLDELKAVLAHEMGHARYKHLFFYILFFVGFMGLSYGLIDLIFYYMLSLPPFAGMLDGADELSTLFSIGIAVPIILMMVLYFRFVMGFFMRNFERQADLYAAVTMKDAAPIINSLEKIALAGGKIRDLPSWHHYSIRERVDCLLKAARDPSVVNRHNRFLGFSFGVYVAAVIGIGWLVNFSDFKDSVAMSFLEKRIERQEHGASQQAALYGSLGMLYHENKDYGKAVDSYEKSLALDPGNPNILNNLAWLLLTAEDESYRDYLRGLSLAELAVAGDRNPAFLDTLAEAHFIRGEYEKALELIEEALSLAGERREYYLRQKEKMAAALERSLKK